MLLKIEKEMKMKKCNKYRRNTNNIIYKIQTILFGEVKTSNSKCFPIKSRWMLRFRRNKMSLNI